MNRAHEEGDFARSWWRAALPLALLSGGLYWLAFPPFNLWPLAFVCWVPLLVAVERHPRRAFALGWLHGLAMVVSGAWVFETARTFTGKGWPAAIALGAAFFAYHALRPALLCWLHARATRRGWPAALVFPLAHASCELLFPAIFPWRAAAQVATCPVWMQAASLGGPIAVGAWLAFTNALLASAWRRGGRLRVRPLVLACAVPAIAAGAGALALRALDARMVQAPVARLALVQPGGEHAGLTRRASLESAAALTRSLARSSPPDLVLWPETIATSPLDGRALGDWWRRTAGEYGEGLDMPVLAGALVRHQDRGSAVLTNSALLFHGREAPREYQKRKRFLFGEYLPFGDTFPALYRWIQGAGHLAAGASPSTLAIGGHLLAPLICYEDVFTDVAAEPVRSAGAELLVTITDDAWFGRSVASSLHLALAKYRAVEHGRFLARAGTDGGTAVIDPGGRVVGALASQETGVLTREVRWLRATTVYDRVGDLPWEVAAAIALVLAVVPRPRRRPSLVQPGTRPSGPCVQKGHGADLLV